MAIYIFNLCFLNPDVYILKTGWYLDLFIAHCIYIFKWKNTADFFKSVCIYPGLKYETLKFALHNLCVFNSNLSEKILYLVSVAFKKAKKNCRQNHIFSIFLLQIIARFLFSAWFCFDKFMSHVSRSKWPLFDLQI